jgi:hypothetical protein
LSLFYKILRLGASHPNTRSVIKFLPKNVKIGTISGKYKAKNNTLNRKKAIEFPVCQSQPTSARIGIISTMRSIFLFPQREKEELSVYPASGFSGSCPRTVSSLV